MHKCTICDLARPSNNNEILFILHLNDKWRNTLFNNIITAVIQTCEVGKSLVSHQNCEKILQILMINCLHKTIHKHIFRMTGPGYTTNQLLKLNQQLIIDYGNFAHILLCRSLFIILACINLALSVWVCISVEWLQEGFSPYMVIFRVQQILNLIYNRWDEFSFVYYIIY